MNIPQDYGMCAPWAIYGVRSDSWGGKAIFKSFYGCAFPVSRNGVFCTCKHVIPEHIPDDEILVVQHPLDTKCHKVQKIQSDKVLDIAMFSVAVEVLYLPLHNSELPLGTDVFAMGYYDWTKNGQNLVIVPQLHKGHITATPRIDVGTCLLPNPWYQLSFPVLPGFSGSPLYMHSDNAYGFEIVGMVCESVVTELAGIRLQHGRAYPSFSVKGYLNGD